MAISPCSINRSPDWYYHQGTKGMDKYDLWRKIHLDPSSEHISKSISDDYVVPFISTFLASYRCEKRYQGECWRLLAGSLWFIICSYAAQSMLFIITSWVEMKYRVTYIQPYVSKRGKRSSRGIRKCKLFDSNNVDTSDKNFWISWIWAYLFGKRSCTSLTSWHAAAAKKVSSNEFKKQQLRGNKVC